MTDDDPTECPNCHGTGQKLARLSPEQDLSFAQRGLPIPKVDCWICKGSGFVDGQSQPRPDE